MDSALNDDELELAVDILFVSLKMLSHGNSLLDEVVKVLWKLRGTS